MSNVTETVESPTRTESPPTPEVRYEASNEETLGNAVVGAVAAEEGVEESELNPLSGALYPAAENVLFENTADSADDWFFSFRYHGYDLTVRADGTILVR
ncbi:HalOD1 output domain-containing protein [Halorussus halophilus]|uniref:HalOD1 output domain-containing protein n=1 Tax=Halorussus halophilus TaxID=2650975 RepID=UPI001301522C|nr:HalOD1 output domain-containing protein [Halorussus halophilus]